MKFSGKKGLLAAVSLICTCSLVFGGCASASGASISSTAGSPSAAGTSAQGSTGETDLVFWHSMGGANAKAIDKLVATSTSSIPERSR